MLDEGRFELAQAGADHSGGSHNKQDAAASYAAAESRNPHNQGHPHRYRQNDLDVVPAVA